MTFLSRQQGDNSDPHQVIPILFNTKEILKWNYQYVVKDLFMVQTRSQTKVRGVNTPKVQRATKPPDGNRRKEIKPISDDAPIVIDLDTKLDIDNQLQDPTVTQTQPYDPTRPEVKQMSG